MGLMRIVFLGTPSFAVPTLEALHREHHELVAVYTQPDRPKGRGQQVAPSPVKQLAFDLGLPVEQPERIRHPQVVDRLRALNPALMVVVGYGQIIPQSIIDIPPLGILNVHASLLPKYRGAAPIQWAIANGETVTGVSIMRIDAGLDTGNVLATQSLPIQEEETAPELAARLAPIGADLLVTVVTKLAGGDPDPGEKQDDSQATLAPILKKEDGLLRWELSARTLYNRFRGFQPWPGAYTLWRGRTLTIAAMRPVTAAHHTGAPGRIQTDRKRLLVSCGDGTALELLTVQPEGKRHMAAEAFLNGYPVEENESLGGVA